MKYKVLTSEIVFVGLLFLFSPCFETVECDRWRLSEITAINFMQQELRDISVKKFSLTSNFVNAVDSMWFDRSDYNLIAECPTTIKILISMSICYASQSKTDLNTSFSFQMKIVKKELPKSMMSNLMIDSASRILSRILVITN
jgi:hypothetical protein